MTKHTHGPWSVGTTLLTNDGARPIMGVDSEGFPKRVALADMQREGVKRGQAWKADCDEREANARLMAAAPDLLEALKYLLAHCKGLDRFEGNPINQAIEDARAAIAKAEGS